MVIQVLDRQEHINDLRIIYNAYMDGLCNGNEAISMLAVWLNNHMEGEGKPKSFEYFLAKAMLLLFTVNAV